MSLIECKNLTLSYDSRSVIENVSFHIDEGSYFCIVGENGSGKSTLIKAILGLMKPTSGTITYQDGFKHTQIGFLPQHSDIQNDFPANVREVVLSGNLNSCGLFPFYSKAQVKRAEEAMCLLGISDIAKKSFRQLSGGQRQRVLLARALCATDKLLLLDEPVSGLDPVVTDELYKIIKELNDGGITVIMVSHDIRSVAEYAKQILHLDKEEWFFGSVEEYRLSDIGHSFLCDHSHCEHEEEHSSEHHYGEQVETEGEGK